jgi:hypothetical protein
LLALVVVDRSGWQATLVLPITAGAVSTFLAWRAVPESRASGGDQVRRGIAARAWSLVLLAVTIGLVALRQAWPNPITLLAVVLSAAGALALAISGRVYLRMAFSQRRREPRRTFSVMLLASAALSLGLTGYLMQLYSFYTVVQDFGTILGGLALFPILLVCVPLARPIARLSVQAPSARLIAGGLACMGVALLFTTLLQPGMPYWPLVLPMALFGIGFRLAQTAWNNAFLTALPTDLVGESSGVSKAAAQAGTVLGTSLLGALVMQYGEADFARRLGDLGLSSEQMAQATNVVNAVLGADLPLGSTGAAVISPTTLFANGLMATYYESFTVGMAVALLWAALACLGVAVLVWLVLHGRRAAQPASAGSVAAVEPSASSGT